MINKLKIGFLVAVLSLAVGVGSAFAAGVTLSSDVTVTIDGYNYVVSSSTSEYTSIVVNATTMVVTMPTTTTITISSVDGRAISATDDLAATSTQTCSSGTSTLTYTASGARTLTITPTGTTQACAGSTNGGGGSHHSSGGSSSSAAAEATASTPGEGCAAGDSFSRTTGKACPVSATIAGCGQGNLFSPVTGQACATSNTTIIVTPGSSGNFGYAFGTLTVKMGSKGAACLAWQTFFNNVAGAHLVLDGKCGPKTMAAARAWQASAGLVADGLLGPKSRAQANIQAAAHTQAQ